MHFKSTIELYCWQCTEPNWSIMILYIFTSPTDAHLRPQKSFLADLYRQWNCTHLPSCVNRELSSDLHLSFFSGLLFLLSFTRSLTPLRWIFSPLRVFSTKCRKQYAIYLKWAINPSWHSWENKFSIKYEKLISSASQTCHHTFSLISFLI